MLRISARCTFTALCKRQGKNCTESGNLCRVNPAYRKKLPFRKGVAFAGLASWHGRCCAKTWLKSLILHLAIALCEVGTRFATLSGDMKTNENQLHALRVKLNDLNAQMSARRTWAWTELVAQQAKIRSIKTKITRLENSR